MGVASFATGTGRAALIRRPPTVPKAAAGAIDERLFVVSMLMLAVIRPRPETKETAVLEATVGKARGGTFSALLQYCPAPQQPGVPSLSIK